MDVKSAFLYGTIEEEVYVSQPSGFVDPEFPDRAYKVEQRKDGIFLRQDKYVCDILKKFGFSSVKSTSTPMETHKPLSKDSDGTDVDVHLYRSMIGSLMYLTSFKPDIMFVVCACLRFQVQPKVSHMHLVKRIFRYLKGHPTLGLWYPMDSPLELIAYSDSDYAGASLNRKSTTGGCQFLGSRLISWQCKKQTIMANSITEAEYIAASSCCGQVLLLQNQLLDYGYNFMQTKIHVDNESAIYVELKRIKADDQAIKTILLGLPEDIYAAVDSCENAQEIWLRVQQMMKGSDIRIQEKKAKLFYEWERFTSNEGESIESYYHHFLKLMNYLKRNKHFPKKIASNLKFLNNLQPEWSRHVTIVHQTKDLHTADYTQLYDFLKYNQNEVDELKAERHAKIQDPLALMANSNNPYAFLAPHQDQPSFNHNYMQQPMLNPEDITDPTIAMNMALALMAKAFKLNYSTPTNNNQMVSSNPCNRQIAQPGMNMGQDRQMQMNTRNQVIQNAVQNPRVQNIRNQNGLIGVQGNGNQNQIGNEFDLMAAAADLDKIKEVNANCILTANLQQASTSGTQSDKAPVYDSDGSAE
nr:uncharacterized mitochondrial protein AtMg00810-like [Tanacetum cinerariifolium]